MFNPHFRSHALDSRVLFEHSTSVVYICTTFPPSLSLMYASIDDVVSVWIPFH